MIPYDPARIFAAMEEAGESRAQAEEDYHLLERNGEILLAQLMVAAKNSGEPIGICKEIARATPEWRTHIEGEAVAVGRRSRARSHWEAVKTYADARQTQEVSLRTMTK